MQALQFLVFESKGDLCLEDLTEHVCPALNHQQLYRLCTTAWSDAADSPGGWWWQLSVCPAGSRHRIMVQVLLQLACCMVAP